MSAEFRANKTSDVISTLVSIYDSKDLFVKEIQALLAGRLLSITDGKFDREVGFTSRESIPLSDNHTFRGGMLKSSKSVSAKPPFKSVMSC